MFDELVKSVRMHLSERLTSPLLGAFVVSWAIWNFRFLLVILSSADIDQKLNLLDSVVFSHYQDVLLRGIVGPIVTALAWIFVYPYPSKYVYEFARKRQRELLDIRRAIEDETPLTIEDTRKFRREFAIKEEDLNAEINRMNMEIKRLREQLDSANSVSSEPKVDAISNDELDEYSFSMLQDLASAHGRAGKRDLLQWSSSDEIRAEYVLNELLERKLLAEQWNEGRNQADIIFTQRGRAAWLKFRDG